VADPLLDQNRPDETNPEDELNALREENECIHHAGHARRLGWVVIQFQKDATKLALGELKDERERHQAEGRCQAFKAMMDRDDEIKEAWQQFIADEESKREGEELEGGDHGIHYAAGQ